MNVSSLEISKNHRAQVIAVGGLDDIHSRRAPSTRTHAAAEPAGSPPPPSRPAPLRRRAGRLPAAPEPAGSPPMLTSPPLMSAVAPRPGWRGMMSFFGQRGGRLAGTSSARAWAWGGGWCWWRGGGRPCKRAIRLAGGESGERRTQSWCADWPPCPSPSPRRHLTVPARAAPPFGGSRRALVRRGRRGGGVAAAATEEWGASPPPFRLLSSSVSAPLGTVSALLAAGVPGRGRGRQNARPHPRRRAAATAGGCQRVGRRWQSQWP